jgi:hypothetical protein
MAESGASPIGQETNLQMRTKRASARGSGAGIHPNDTVKNFCSLL